MQNIFIGIDGGASKSVACVESETGRILATALGGPANVRLSVSQAVQSITQLLHQVLAQSGFCLEQEDVAFHCGIGIAGCEIDTAVREFIQCMPKFNALIVLSDAKAACLGAHSGKEGAIIIVGTGVVGYQITKNREFKIGGWGFPHDDQGGGAWLGLAAVNHTLKAYDNRQTPSQLSKKLLQHFQNEPEQLVIFANRANASEFAQLAPMVVQAAQTECYIAQTIMQNAAKYIDEIATAMLVSSKQPLKCALVGGIAPYMEKYLGEFLKQVLVPCEQPPQVGALLAIKQKVKQYA